MSYEFRISIFEIAFIWNKNSLPDLLAGSPVHDSSLPRIAYDIFALLRIFTKAFVTFFDLSSKLPAQPIQNRYSGFSPLNFKSDKIGTFIIIYLNLRHQRLL